MNLNFGAKGWFYCCRYNICHFFFINGIICCDTLLEKQKDTENVNSVTTIITSTLSLPKVSLMLIIRDFNDEEDMENLKSLLRSSIEEKRNRKETIATLRTLSNW